MSEKESYNSSSSSKTETELSVCVGGVGNVGAVRANAQTADNDDTEQKKVWKQQNFWEMFVHFHWKLLFIVAERVREGERGGGSGPSTHSEMSLHWFLPENDLHILRVAPNIIIMRCNVVSVVCVGLLFSIRNGIMCN